MQSHKITTNLIKIIGFCDPMNIQKMFFLAVLLDNCYKMMIVWLATQTFKNYFVSEYNGNTLVGLQIWI